MGDAEDFTHTGNCGGGAVAVDHDLAMCAKCGQFFVTAFVEAVATDGGDLLVVSGPCLPTASVAVWVCCVEPEHELDPDDVLEVLW